MQLIITSTLSVHSLETERMPASCEEILPAPYQRDQIVLQEETPSPTGDKEENRDQQYNIIPNMKMLTFPYDEPPTRYNNLQSQASNTTASVIAEEHTPLKDINILPRMITYSLHVANDAF